MEQLICSYSSLFKKRVVVLIIQEILFIGESLLSVFFWCFASPVWVYPDKLRIPIQLPHGSDFVAQVK